MIYVALLRGINVGGKNIVNMATLKKTFEELGFTNVTTYINSGNIIFSHDHKPAAERIEEAIEQNFGLLVPVLLRSKRELESLTKVIPAAWVNNAHMKCDVMFLWQDIDNPKVLDLVQHKPEFEDVRYVSGALVWRVDRKDVKRGGQLQIVGTEPYKKMTIRNINTVRKLYELMQTT